MRTTRAGAALIGLVAQALLARGAMAAQHHHICYEDAPTTQNGQTTLHGVAECRADDGPCVIAQRSFPNSQSPGMVTFSTTATVSSSFWVIAFADGATQSCTVNLSGKGPSPGATLVGYTTDASGLLTTGVWKRRSRQRETLPDGKNRSSQVVVPPGDFVTVGGGVVAAEAPDGALVYESWQDAEGWRGGTADSGVSQPRDNETYVIAMNVEGLAADDLAAMIRQDGRVSTTQKTTPNEAAPPKAVIALPDDFLPLSGGISTSVPYSTSISGLGQFATGTRPTLSWTAGNGGCDPTNECVSVSGWSATSKDHGAPTPGTATVRLVSINRNLTIGGDAYHFESNVAIATSMPAGHPGAVVAGKAGEYALSGIGAFVDWQTSPSAAGNLIWQMMPRPDIDGAEVGSKDNGASSPATITAYALGVKLVPGVWAPPAMAVLLP
jgi:hypothetical protein